LRRPLPFHYGWVIVATGALILFACLGLARYAYTMLLPGMSAGLGLSYDRMGFISTGNFAGYFLSVLLAPRLLRHYSPRQIIVAGLLLISSCMLALSHSHEYTMIVTLYTLVGFGGGFANIPLMTIVPRWFRSQERGKAIGLVIGGNGAAIVFAGILIPALNRFGGGEGWRSGWLVLGLMSLGVSVVAGVLLRNSPAEMGLEAVGVAVPVEPASLLPHEHPGDRRVLLHLGLLYLVFGATFMVFGTFIVTTMVKEFHFSEARAGLYWSWVGLGSTVSGVVFGALSDRIGRKWGLALVFIIQSVAYGLVGFPAVGGGLLVAIILYGLVLFAIPTIMTAAVADYFGLARAAGTFATVTLLFAIGQTLGPGAAGLIAKVSGTFTTAYALAALLTVSAAVGACFLPPPVKGREQHS
jgi:MFS family permease